MEAESLCRQILVMDPRHAESLHVLGVIAQQLGRSDVAVDLLRQSIALKPNDPQAYGNLGVALKDTRQWDEAIAAYRQAIALRPNLPEAYSNLGNLLRNTGRLEEAIAACGQAIALRAHFPEAHNNLGLAFHESGRLEQAIASYRNAIALKPNYPEAHGNLGLSLYDKGRLDEAIASYRQAIALKPNNPEVLSNLGNALKDTGQVEAAIAAHREAIAITPAFPEAHSNLLFTLNYQPGSDPRAIAEEHRRWDQQHAEPLRRFILPHPNLRDPERRLRVGYVSADFREHPVAYFLENLLAAHDPSQVEVSCFSNVVQPDEVTDRLRQYATYWHCIVGMPDAQVVELIRHNEIDILVDLAGHSAGNRLLVFARRPAPVQASWLGYPNTTGLGAMDFRLTDDYADPPGTTERFQTERLVRLPRCAWCFHPSEKAPAVNAPPAVNAGHITFGCFNAMPKINGSVLKLWSQILVAVPGSRLLLKNAAFRESSAQQRVRGALEDSGIAPKRLELIGRVTDVCGHLSFYGKVDIALDTYPYHGTTTTCEAMWMGVPVVSLAGDTHVSRVGVSLLSNTGLAELVAESPEDYVRRATGLAMDLPRLTELRNTLRERMKGSALMDSPAFARDIETAYRQMWRQWCAKHA